MSVSDALEYLATSPEAIKQATIEEARLEELKKNVLAEIGRASNLKTASEREAYARAQPEYHEIAQDKYPEAKGEVAFHKAKTKWADATISVWQTQNANKRAAERVR